MRALARTGIARGRGQALSSGVGFRGQALRVRIAGVCHLRQTSTETTHAKPDFRERIMWLRGKLACYGLSNLNRR